MQVNPRATDVVDPEGGAELVALLADPARRVSPRARWWWLVRALLRAVVLLGLVAVWALVDDAHRGPQLVVGGSLAALTLGAAAVEPFWRYRVHRWDVTDTAVVTRSGWITQERRVAPVSRVQTVDVERGPIAGAFGLVSVRVTTASAHGPVDVEGLDAATADDLVARLTAVTARTPGDAT